jgi:hypothetical protein
MNNLNNLLNNVNTTLKHQYGTLEPDFIMRFVDVLVYF